MSTLSELEASLKDATPAGRPSVLRGWCLDGGHFLDAPYGPDAERFPIVCELLLEAPTRWVARLVAEAAWPVSDQPACARLHRLASTLTAA